eukprot:2798548-Rhodomonas_salina.4
MAHARKTCNARARVWDSYNRLMASMVARRVESESKKRFVIGGRRPLYCSTRRCSVGHLEKAILKALSSTPLHRTDKIKR